MSALLKKSGSTSVETIKLFLVGHPAKGKSTLKTSLTTGVFKSLFMIRHHENRIPTPGIEVEEKTIGGAGSFMIWDTAGQVEFHITHAMLLGTGRGIFIVVYSCCDAEDEQKEQLKYWLCFIKACHDPTEDTKPVIQLIGTHVDQLKDLEMAAALSTRHVEYLQSIFQDHVRLNEHVILLDSRRTRSNALGKLKDALNEIAEPLRGELTPKLCDKIMKRLSSWCNTELPLLYFKDFAEHVRQQIDRLVKDETLNLVLGYLHDMGQVHHAKLRGHDAIIIVHLNWLTTTIFAPIFAPPNFRADYSGLPLKQEYTIDDLKHHFKLTDENLLVDLLEYFELAYRNDDGTFIIPAKLPDSTDEIAWVDNPRFQRYFGRRIECRDESDMLSIDTFPCLQVSAMNRYRRKHVKPKLSRSGVKVFGAVEGMVQLTRDKRAIHIAVRVKEGVSELKKGRNQLQEMESLVFDQITERSRGTEVTVSYLSPDDLKNSSNLEDGVRFYDDEVVQDAIKKRDVLVNPVTLVPESVRDVNPNSTNRATGIAIIIS
ncbi:death-associated protein kinase 1-like [Amphiura filiformis]|uniref:death-associated protein kinase 1-like n=1 Tax=Amphiura filiformis TaxID=82378 RepID=UPI003B21294E